MVPLDEKKRQMLGRFVSSLFHTGEEPDKPRGMLASAKGNATPFDIVTFVQRREVLEASSRFLNEIHSLWNQSKGENFAPGLPQPRNLPAVPSDSQMRGSRMGNPMNDDKSAKPDTTIQTIGLVPPAPPLVSPLSSATLAAMQENQLSPEPAAAVPPSATAAALATPALTTTPAASATQPAGSATVNPSAKPGQIPLAGAPAGKPLAPKATFQIPNAKVGVPYVGRIEGSDQNGAAVRVRTPIVPPGLGLLFDEASGELKGVPLTDGEQRISLQWSSEGSSWFSGECMIFINPDPRSLWKNIDPPADDPYFKPNIDSATVKAPAYSIIAASRRGRSHEHSGTFRDDDFFVAHDPAANWSVMIVADGAGSAKNSRRGSKLAVEAFGGHLKTQLASDLGRKLATDLACWSSDPKKTGQLMGTDFHYLFHKAGTLAVQAIESEAQAKCAPVKDYSTTLLAAVARLDGDGIFLSTFWMGDGAIAAYGPRGKVRLMGTPDGGEFAGQTRFLDRAALADTGFAKRIGIGRYSEISALILMTDGVSDPRFETDAGLADPVLWDQLWDELLPLVKSGNPDKALVDWLHFFTPGHHDDRTIALLV